ncbi:MAG: hypothetical protein ACKODH_02165 [Limisphaerales bacterium]
MGRQQFNEFKASELFCPKCGSCQPVRERASAAPGESSVELLCSRCATVVGQHTVVDNSLTGKLTRLAGGLFGRSK